MPEALHLPTGAEALLIALATPSPQGPRGIPVLLWGRPGVGKSSFIEGLAGPGLTVTTLIASIHDPTDFSGLPFLQDGGVHYASPEWVEDFRKTEDGILFLDELSTAPPSVQAALLRVVFERKVGFTPLPDGVRIVAAANPPDLMVGGWDLSPPLRNRFVHLDWDIPEDLYLRSLRQGWASATLPSIDAAAHAALLPEWKIRVGGFLRIRPEALHGNPEEDLFGFGSPRTWDFVCALLTSCELLGYRLDTASTSEQQAILGLVRGCVGEATALQLIEHLTNLRLPDPRAVLAGREKVDVGQLDDAELHVLFYGLNARLLPELEGEKLLPYSAVYLDLADRVFIDGRRDVIFVHLKELARAGWLARVAAAGQSGSAGNYEEVMQRIGSVFGDEAFNEFVNVLG